MTAPIKQRWGPADWILVIVAVGGVITSTITTWNTGRKADRLIEKAVVGDAKLDRIHSDTNSNLTKANERIAALEKLLEARVKPETKKP